MPAVIASLISDDVLLVPLKMICRASKPARNAVKSSPPLLTSTSIFCSRTALRMATFEFAFDA
jgi:hypothetical protein